MPATCTLHNFACT